MITIPFNLTVQRRQWTIPRRDAVMSTGDTLRFAVTVYDSELSVTAKVLTGFTAELRIYSTRPQRDGYGYEYDIEAGEPLVSVEGVLQETQGLLWFTLSADDTCMISTGRYILSFALQSENGSASVSRGVVNISAGVSLPGPIPLVGFQDAYELLDAGTEEAEFTVERTRIASGASVVSTVVWTTSAGTTGPLSFGPGDLGPKTISLSVADETVDWRVFTITLSDAVNADYAIRVMTIEVSPLLLTSRPYPIDLIEEIQVANAAVTSIYLYTSIYDIEPETLDIAAQVTSMQLRDQLQVYGLAEAMDIGAAITSIALTSVLYSYTSPAEAMDIGAAITSIALTSVLYSYTSPAEAMDIGAAVTSSALATVLVSYSVPAEAMDIGSAQVTGIALT